MSTKQLDRLKSQLLTSGLQQRDNATWQVINQLIDILRGNDIAVLAIEEELAAGSDAITALTTDVVATGPGAVPATIQPLAVTTGKINDLAVTTGKINDLAVTTAKINDLAVTTGKIDDNDVTYAKMQQVTATSRLLGNGSAAAPANVREITLGTNLSMSGDTLNATGGGGPSSGHWSPVMTGISLTGYASDSEMILNADGDAVMAWE